MGKKRTEKAEQSSLRSRAPEQGTSVYSRKWGPKWGEGNLGQQAGLPGWRISQRDKGSLSSTLICPVILSTQISSSLP